MRQEAGGGKGILCDDFVTEGKPAICCKSGQGICLQHFFHAHPLDKRGQAVKICGKFMISAKISRDEMAGGAPRLQVLPSAARGRRKNPHKLTRKEIASTLKRLIREAQAEK